MDETLWTALPLTAALILIVVLLIITINVATKVLKTFDFNAGPALAGVNVALLGVDEGENEDKLLELLKRRQQFLPDNKVPSLLDACSQTFMKEIPFFSGISNKTWNPLDSVPTTLRSHLLETMGNRQLVWIHGKDVLCDTVKMLLHNNLKSFDFKVCGPYSHPNGEALDKEVLETLASKCSGLEKIVDKRLDHEATHNRIFVPVTEMLQTVIQMKKLKSIKLTGRYYWTIGDVCAVAEALPKLEVLWLQLQMKPNLQLVDALSNFKCLKQLSWSVRPRETPRFWSDDVPLTVSPNIVPVLAHQFPHLQLAGVAMTPDDQTWGHHGPLLFEDKVYPNLVHMKVGSDFNISQLNLIAKVPLCFPNITSLCLQTKTGLTDYITLLEQIGSQLKEFRHDSDDVGSNNFDNSSALGALLQLAPRLSTLKLIGSMKYSGPVVPIMKRWLTNLTDFQMTYIHYLDSCHQGEVTQIITFSPKLKSLVIEGECLVAPTEVEDLLTCLKNRACLQELESCISNFDTNKIELWKHLIVYCPRLRILPRSLLYLRRLPKMSKFLKLVNVKICPLYMEEEDIFCF